MDEWNLKKDKEDIWVDSDYKNPYHKPSENSLLTKVKQCVKVKLYGLLSRDCISQKRVVILGRSL